MRRYLCYAVGSLFGLLMLLGGAFVLNYMPNLFASKIKSQLPLLKGTEAYNRFITPSVPLSVKIYMFNVTNPDQVTQFGAKPILEQLGPFAMTERRRKEVTSISPDNKLLDFRLYRSFYLNPNESEPFDLRITLPNAPAFSAFHSARNMAVEEEGAANPEVVVGDYVGNEPLYLTRTAEEWLFKGVKIGWLDAMEKDGIEPNNPPPDNTFGFFYKKNNTWDEVADGTLTVSTGVDGNFTNIGRIVKWNQQPTLDFWKGEYCNQIRGTDGQFFHPFVQKDEQLHIFAPDLCRSLTVEFIKTTSIRTIELYRFGIASSFFKPINHDEQTSCYCVKRSVHEKKEFCKLSGVVDASSCRKKPIILSTPHFLNGDPTLREQVIGLSPSQTHHDTFLDIEPMTGTVLRVRRRMQLNVEMTPAPRYLATKALNKTLIHPFVWMDQSIVVTDEIAQKLENRLTKIVRMVRILCYAALITGSIILVATLIFTFRDVTSEDKKIRGIKPNQNKKDTGGDYQKVQVIMKPMNSGASNDNK